MKITPGLWRCVLDYDEYIVTNTDGDHVAAILADEDIERHKADAIAISLLPEMLDLLDEAQLELSLASSVLQSYHVDVLLDRISSFFNKIERKDAQSQAYQEKEENIMNMIKPCPHCKEPNCIALNHRTNEDPSFSIRCYNCGFQTKWFNTTKDAIENWNKGCSE